MKWKWAALAAVIALYCALSCCAVPLLSERVYAAIAGRDALFAPLCALFLTLILCAALRWAQGEAELSLRGGETRETQRRLLRQFLETGLAPGGREEAVGLVCRTAEDLAASRLGIVSSGVTIAASALAILLYIGSASLPMLGAVALLTAALTLAILQKSATVREQAQRLTELDNGLVSIQWDYIHNQEVSRFLNPKRLFAHYQRQNDEKRGASIALSRTLLLPMLTRLFGVLALTLAIALCGGLLCHLRLLEVAKLFGILSAAPAIASSLFLTPSLLGDVHRYRGVRGALPQPAPVRPGNGRAPQPGPIEARGLWCRDTLRGVDFSAHTGRLTVIAGPSGCGKTTLLRLLLGLLAPDKGSIRYAGQELDALDTALFRRHVFYLSATPYLPRRSLREFVLIRQEDARRYDEIVRRLRLAELDGRETLDPLRLSEGEKQKVLLAKMLLSGRRVWICDEPTNKLDEDTEREVLALVREQVRLQGVAAVFTTHREQVLHAADDLWRMEDGRMEVAAQ